MAKLKKRMPPQRPPVLHSDSKVPPVGGLNLRDAISLMPSNDAVELVNWIAQQYGVRSRKGYLEWAVNFPDQVKTIMEYVPARASVANYRMFAVTDNNIYNITSTTDAPPVSTTMSGVTDIGRVSWTNLVNAGTTNLLVCSYLGGYKTFNGTVWATPTLGAGPGQVTPVDPVNLSFVTMWKGRAWFLEKNSTRAWYAAPGAITGTFAQFDFGPLMKKGGVLSFIASWTIDAGTGIDDYLVIGGENGDILIYKGTDPSSSTTFGIVGNWYVGRLPVGQRNFVQYGGDLLILSDAGIQPLSYVTRGGQSMFRVSSVDYLSKVQQMFGVLLAGSINQQGWEICIDQTENLLMLQQPTNTMYYEQYAMYTNGNTWSRIRGMPMSTMFSGAQGFFFATPDNRVCKGFSGYFDDVQYGATVGNGIAGIIQPAYNYFNLPGQNKQWHMLRPTFLTVDKPAVTVTMVADFAQNTIPGSPIYSLPSGSLWDISRWDIAVWSGGLQSFSEWVGAAALGYAGSAIISTIVTGDTYLASIDYTYEAGGVL